MPPKEDIGWLDIGRQEDSCPAIINNDRLESIISQLNKPEEKYPSVCAYLGGRFKDHVLQRIYPWNNIKRHVSNYRLRLRSDIASLGCRQPILFVDGDIGQNNRKSPLKRLSAGVGHPVLWECGSVQDVLVVLWARLVFLFTDVICIFLSDFPDHEKILELLTVFSKARSGYPVLAKLLPRLLLISEGRRDDGRGNTPAFTLHQTLHGPEYTSVFESFSGITTIHLEGTTLSDTARCEPLRALVGRELDAMRSVRQRQRVQPNGKHLVDLFQAAFQHILVDPDIPFDLIRVTRAIYTVSPHIKQNLVHYFDVCNKAGVHGPQVAPTIASAVLMDNYVPGMLMLDPRMVFRTFYRSAILEAYNDRASYWPDLPSHDQASGVESHLVGLFDTLIQTHQTAVEVRKHQLTSQSGWLCRIRSNRICVYCLFQAAQHVLGCGHTLCDRCAHIFGTPTAGLEYQFTIQGCIYCLYQRPLVASILPPTMSPSVLAIDGGGVRGVIPLEFLLLVQEHLQPCRIQDVVDLSLGTSSGGLIAIGLFIMSWDMSTCSETFDKLARRIFRTRRRSPFALLNFSCRNGSMLSNVGRWLHWLLHDSCYDAQVFDDALKSVFGENRLMFGSSRDDPRGSLQSRSKIGVVTTSISRGTEAFVIGNFNTVSEPEDKGGKCQCRSSLPTLLAHLPMWIRYSNPPATQSSSRAKCMESLEQLLQPLCNFFTPADLPGIGSFQDGGLKHNFAGEIASQISHLIWPEAIGSTRLLSLGTGVTQPEINPTPHFRHVFRDSFIRRSFDAWMSTMDTEGDWRKLKGQLNVAVRSEYHRLNVDLSGESNAIDSVESMEDYRNLVLSQPGSSRRARDAATTLLVSRFYFELKELPQNTTGPFWCRGLIRCKGSAKDLIFALTRLYPEGLTYVSGNNVVDDFNGFDELCESCGSYLRPLSFLVPHINHPADLFLQASPTKRWRLSGFPESLATFAAKQGLTSSFGHGNHGLPSRIPCSGCDALTGPSQSTTKRRRRPSSTTAGVSKKFCLAFERSD
ncbi:unnamed protein product [Penicillium olsonii]|nr:unnamed protein product [Penicillium olsonii]CAG8119744.1 unnamed protein product [Penicillium olsonii]